MSNVKEYLMAITVKSHLSKMSSQLLKIRGISEKEVSACFFSAICALCGAITKDGDIDLDELLFRVREALLDNNKTQKEEV